MARADMFGALPTNSIMVKLKSLGQGADLAIVPALWQRNMQIPFQEIGIFFYTSNPTVGHSFSFFLNGGLQAAVTVTTSGNYWRTATTFSMKGQTDYLSVRHDTNAQDGDESASHVNEGTEIWAVLVAANT